MHIEQRYAQDFAILKEKGNLVENWSKCYDHCKTEALIAEIISELLNLSPEEKVFLTRACILHDWYKRVERERENYDSQDSYNKLLELGIEKRIVDIAHSVGHTSLDWIESSDDFLRKIMHYIDDITFDTSVVGVIERVDGIMKRGIYDKLAEETRAKYNGKTFFEVQKEVGIRIQHEIEEKAGLAHDSLTGLIQQRLESINKDA
jgi:hypothetical protein